MSKSWRLPFPEKLRAVALPAAMVVALMLAAPVSAQNLGNSFGGLSQSSDEPIDIESDVLVVHDKQKLATFKGNVKAVQGTTTLRARELDVHYLGGDKLGSGKPTAAAAPLAETAGAPGASGDKKDTAAEDGTKISKIEAKGDVIITSEDDQTTTSDWALYDVPAQLVTVGGNVVLTQGDNVLKGDRLVIDLRTGESRFENTGNNASGGRIRALFMPKGAAKDAEGDGAEAVGTGQEVEAPVAEKPEKPMSIRAPEEPLPLPSLPDFRN